MYSFGNKGLLGTEKCGGSGSTIGIGVPTNGISDPANSTVCTRDCVGRCCPGGVTSGNSAGVAEGAGDGMGCGMDGAVGGIIDGGIVDGGIVDGGIDCGSGSSGGCGNIGICSEGGIISRSGDVSPGNGGFARGDSAPGDELNGKDVPGNSRSSDCIWDDGGNMGIGAMSGKVGMGAGAGNADGPMP